MSVSGITLIPAKETRTMNTIDNITKIGNTLNFCDTRNNHGRTFRFTIINTGDAYGRNLCLLNDKEPMVEVWDTTQAPQMVSRYYISTLLGTDNYGTGGCWQAGLNLHGGEPVWKIDAHNLLHVHQWLLEIVGALNDAGDAA